MNNKKPLIFIYVMIFIISCTQSPGKVQKNDSTSKATFDKISTDSTVPATMPKASTKSRVNHDSLDCDQLIVLLMRKSSLDSDVTKMNFNARIDGIKKGILRIELTLKNTERNEDVPLTWIDLDRTKKELRDVTVDPDRPIILKYDSALFALVSKHCVMQE